MQGVHREAQAVRMSLCQISENSQKFLLEVVKSIWMEYHIIGEFCDISRKIRVLPPQWHGAFLH